MKIILSLKMILCLYLLIIAIPSSTVYAYIFRIELPVLEREYRYGDYFAADVDINTALSSLTGLQVEISGEHTNGWWVGDQVESFYSGGPAPGRLSAWMVHYLSEDIPQVFYCMWTETYFAGADGQFTTTLTLERFGGGSDWSFLEDGIIDLCLENEGQMGTGAGFTSGPVFNLTNVTLIIDAVPVPEPSNMIVLSVGFIGLLVYVRRRWN